jgi:hypothetical protein
VRAPRLHVLAAAASVVAGLAAASVAAAPPGVAVRCRAGAVAVKWDARGHVQVLEYRAREKDPLHPVATGRILAYADATTRTVNPVCRTAKVVTPRVREYDSASFATDMPLLFFCDQHYVRDSAFLIQIRPVFGKGRAIVGNRLLVQSTAHPKAAPIVDATMRGRQSRFTVRVQSCFRLYDGP